MSAPPSRAKSKNEGSIREGLRATSIYEPWMDGEIESIKSTETRETLTPTAQKKQRSAFKFDRRYLDSASSTPTPPVIHSPIPSPIPAPILKRVKTPVLMTIPLTPLPTKDIPDAVVKPKKNVGKKPTTRSVATSPIIFDSEDNNYAEFFDWVSNGNEDDIDEREIERMLFYPNLNLKRSKSSKK